VLVNELPADLGLQILTDQGTNFTSWRYATFSK
jgi:hypothetical protein